MKEGRPVRKMFYYIGVQEDRNNPDAGKVPRITVCLLECGGEVARGLSICSVKDMPKKTAW